MPIQKPRKPFPAWRLPKGMIKAADAELGNSIESCERWEWFGGGLVVVGVVAAVVIAAIHPKYDSFMEQWGSAIADGLVAIGVAVEIKFGQMAGLRQSELKRRSDIEIARAKVRAHKAEQRAMEAELEAAKVRAQFSWRALTAPQVEKIALALGRVTGATVTLMYVQNDPESATFAEHFWGAFRMAHWRVGLLGVTFGAPVRFGITIASPEEVGSGVASIIHAAFTAAGIECEIGSVPSWGMAMGSEGGTGPNHCRVYIGPAIRPFQLAAL
jgi:hypothetical protein